MEKERENEQEMNISENETQAQEENTVVIKEVELKKLQDELAQYKDKYIRLYAEFDNARKRMEREKQEFVKYANEELIVSFLNILDDLERTIEAAKSKHQDYDAFLKGTEMVMAHVYDLLKKNNVKPVKTLGLKFDPNCHEVLMQEETNNFEDGIVMEEFQKGYCLGDKIVRTAKVKLAKKKEN
jgi:molecular chaperone GrpE